MFLFQVEFLISRVHPPIAAIPQSLCRYSASIKFMQYFEREGSADFFSKKD